jgi:hypothetical protein
MTKYEGDTTAVLTKLRKIREGAHMPCGDIVDVVDEAMNIEGRMLNALYDPKPGIYFPRDELSKIKQLHLETHTAFDIAAERCCMKDLERGIIDADEEAEKHGIRGRAGLSCGNKVSKEACQIINADAYNKRKR